MTGHSPPAIVFHFATCHGRIELERTFTLAWNTNALSQALRIEDQDVVDFFTDGRRLPFVVERRLKLDYPDWGLAQAQGSGFVLVDPENGRWDVRSITKSGVYFCPSYMVGSGRAFVKDEFNQKLREINGFILSDVTLFPDVPIYKIPVQNVIRWYDNRLLDNQAKVTRNKFLSNLANDIQF